MSLVLVRATLPEQIETVRILLREYAAYLNQSLGEEHICLDDYEKELADLPGVYAEPQGASLLGLAEERAAGCIALKPLKPSRAIETALELNEAACEMKRLWVRPKFRGQTVGRIL